MLKKQIAQIVKANPEYAAITPVIEKEILHHDIMDVLVQHGAMQKLTFIGGTSLRMCYNSSRLSEDLDFNAGHNFKPSEFDGLEIEIQSYISKKYETDVWVNKPTQENQGNTSSWKISIEKEANRPDLPRQKMHIDVCAIPSLDIEKRALINHYQIVAPTEGLLVPVQSMQEILIDKIIALTYRSRRIKPRDIWDLVWLKQRGVKVTHKLLKDKLEVRAKNKDEFKQMLEQQVHKVRTDETVSTDFNNEMSRFITNPIKQRTIDNPDYWPYVQNEVQDICEPLYKEVKANRFDMGL